MYNMMSGDVTFFNVNDNDSLLEFIEKYGYSEYNEDESNLLLTIEENYDMESIDDVIDLFKEFIEVANTNNIIMIGKLDNSAKNSTHAFEIVYVNDKLKYRESLCDMSDLMDDDLTYDEYQEEGNIELDEEEFEDYLRKKSRHTSYVDDDYGYDDYNEFGEWIYVNLE